MKSVLTVCVGNICRSPMAEGLLKEAMPDMRIESAGIGALVGHRADPLATAILASRGIDISSHIARQINQSLSRQADLILVMAEDQRKYIVDLYPYTRGKIFLLNGAGSRDVPDPYQMGEDAFRAAFDLIEIGVKGWVANIQKIAKQERHTI